MATKPGTSPPIWASNANWTVGPRTGQPTKVAPSAGQAQEGQVGGRSFKGQWSNYLHNLCTTWIATWVALGSSAGAEDAHLVETDANGSTTVAQITVTGRAAGTYGGQFTGTSGAGPATGVRGIGVGNAVGVSGTGGNGGTSGSGVLGTSGTTAGAYGVRGVAAGTNNTGVRGEGIGTGDGGSFLGGDDGDGLTAAGGATAGAGVVATGTSTRGGVEGVGGSSNGPGLLGTAGGASGFGVDGRSHASASSTGAAVRGLATADGIGVHGQAADGYGVQATSDTTSPTRSALRIVPQNADPTTAANGDVFFSSQSIGGLDRDDLRVRRRGAWRSVAVETRGMVRAFGRDAGTSTATTSGVPVTALTGVSLAAPDEPRETGVVWIRLSGEVARATGSGQNAILRIVDETDTVTVASRTIHLHQAASASAYERTLDLLVPYTLPAVGARSFGVEIETDSTGDNVRVRDIALQIYGVL